MFKNINIGGKITTLTALIVLIGVAISITVAYNLNKDKLESEYLNQLSVVNRAIDKDISNRFNMYKNTVEAIAGTQDLQEALSLYNDYSYINPDSVDSLIAPVLNRKIYSSTQSNLYITDITGNILASTDGITDVNIETIAESILQKATETSAIGNLQENESGFAIYAAAPVKFNSSNVGYIVTGHSLNTLYPILEDTSYLGKTGENLLVSRVLDRAIYVSPSRTEGSELIKRSVSIEEQTASQNAVRRVMVTDTLGSMQDIDYANKEVLSVWRPIQGTNLGIVTKIDQDEIYSSSNELLRKLILGGIGALIFTIIISLLITRTLTKPLKELQNIVKNLSKGILPNKIGIRGKDEIGQIASATRNLVSGLKRTANFAKQIGEGHYDAEFQPLSNEDTIGTSLINMRDSIQQAEKRDQERNWIVIGVAEIGEILRAHNDLDTLGYELIKYITKKTEAIQGAFYVVQNEKDSDDYAEARAVYAYNKQKQLRAKFKFAEGLVGQAWAERDTIFRTEIPYDYVTLTSGLLGEQRPTSLLIVPLIANEIVYGVIEIAGFKKFSPTHVKFVEELSTIIAQTIFNIQVNDRTRKLLQESQAMSNELQEKQEVLRQNAEEMEATQEELRRTNNQLEEQIEEVNRTQKRMQLLLENASEVITIYEEDQTIRYISPSVEKILGHKTEEMIGIKDIKFVEASYKESVNEMFNKLLENPDEQITIQYEYQTADGNLIWIESTGNNLLNDKAIQGIIVNSRDITEKRLAEQEQRMRSKMQALSENSPDLITRIESDGEVSYINPTIEAFTGQKPDIYLHKHVEELDLNSGITDYWMEVLNQVKEHKEKITNEIDFPTDNGNLVMQVNAIPEYNEADLIESVLVVSHDITARKAIELEIQNKNKKINDSINYAKRIQGAILPNNKVINKTLPESFIFYRPKDVVSGDFPWYLQQGDDIFIAAVDCTGHGVPGALLSLIGYFLLNDIVRSRKITEPGKILDLLDEGVTTTLRQDSDDSKTKDGMDIALCKINLKDSTLEYAGAHRPLYMVQNGELVEVKGNKFPIGGGLFKNQTEFTNTVIKFNPGDSAYICSDGFPDQFGGPQNRKFGPKRTRQLIMDNHNKPMKDVYGIFKHEWENWMSDEKQTDDVLMIGMKF
ncbi:PAS domain S-box protein [Marinigracilibium pacificum]|uniref:PAS domain S-box protein n=1 Tax=Marinigracilibium pacificum TaxID=2729599 RepID=A0A848J656_9BACT|nr:PAS domain S-box protein [Marinigracilibium pacificum]NMM48612.1 PAS domain S-box protein [Marinigracilibium pacificum]